MARYGNQKSPFLEEMKPEPVDPYGIAKVAGEETLKVLANLNNMEWNIAVPHNIIGPNQKYDDPFRNVLSIFINRNLQNKPSIIYGDGNQIRCFSYIDDVIYCLEKLALDKKINTPSYNQVTEKIYTRASGRWKNYKNEMHDIMPLMQFWIEKWGY